MTRMPVSELSDSLTRSRNTADFNIIADDLDTSVNDFMKQNAPSFESTDEVSPFGMSGVAVLMTGDPNEEVIAQPSPVAINQAKGQTTTTPSPSEKFDADTQAYNKQVTASNKVNSGNILLDFVESLSSNLVGIITSIVDNPLSIGNLDEVFRLLAQGKNKEAFAVLVNYIDKPFDFDNIIGTVDRSLWAPEIIFTHDRISRAEEMFSKTDVSLSGNTRSYLPYADDAGVNSLGATDAVSTRGKTKNGTNTLGENWNFDDITSQEELEFMLRAVNRAEENEISGATIHWSATFKDQNIDSEWINRVHIEKGYTGIGYHIIIRRDGTLQRGRPLNERGAHDENNNANFLGFCFVGGIDAYAGTIKKPYWKHASVNSLTIEQFKAYDILMSTFHRVYPFAQVQSHQLTSNEGKVDPGFDVEEYSYKKFGHRNIIDESDPRWRSTDPIDIAYIREQSRKVNS